MALLVVVLATMLAVAISARAATEFRRVETTLRTEQAMQYVFGAEQWVTRILLRDREESDIDDRTEPWAVELPPLPVEGGIVVGRLQDLHGRFNLTNLVREDGAPSPADMVVFRRLIAILGIDDAVRTDAVVDFIDRDIDPTIPSGAEDGVYLGADPPRRTPNRPLVAISELAFVDGATGAAIALLAPHVVTLPRRTAINVNTLEPITLMALAEGLPEAAADALVADSFERGYDSVEQFRSLLGVRVDEAIELGMSSEWFRLTVEVQIGSTSLRMYSLLERAANGRTRVIARSRTPW